MKYFLAAGGLGNQLFIWNAAHIINLKTDESLKIVYPRGNKIADRNNELEILKKFCSHNIEITQSQFLFTLIRIRDRIANRSQAISNIFDFLFRIYKSDNPEAELKVSNVGKKIFVGYFQNSKQTLETFKDIYSELTQLEDYLTPRHADLLEKLEKSHWTGIHIRRGDYLQNREKIGVISFDYFTPLVEADNLLIALEYKRDLKPIPGHPIVISGEDYSPWESFFILARCKEIWISNSTYSWWVGVFASCRESKIVAPTPWNAAPSYSITYLQHPLFELRQSKFEP